LVFVRDEAKAAEMKDRLENQGFLVVKIVTTPFARGHVPPL
jgi:hypothetical protein